MLKNEGTLNKNIIIDIGSGYCKSGFSGHQNPSSIFPSIIGRPISSDILIDFQKTDYLIGNQSLGREGLLNLSYPVQHGIITNWEDIEKIWDYCFTKELRIKAKDHNIFITEPPMNPSINKEKIATIMFETFGTCGFYIGTQSVLSLYSEGKINGFVVDIGDDTIHFTPLFNGHSFPHATKKINFGGRYLTEYLGKLLNKKGENFSNEADMEIVKDIKENLCFVALDYEEEIKKGQKIEYELPDGRIIKIGEEGFGCPECLFRPDICGKDTNGIDQIIVESINDCSKDIWNDLYGNIILAGGSSMFSGLPERIFKEVKNKAPDEMKTNVKINFSNEKKYSSWIGAATISSMSSFNSMWVTKKEYDEVGSAVVSHKMMVNTIGRAKE